MTKIFTVKYSTQVIGVEAEKARERGYEHTHTLECNDSHMNGLTLSTHTVSLSARFRRPFAVLSKQLTECVDMRPCSACRGF